jgi:hypothetical protein
MSNETINAGENPIEMLVDLGFRQGADAMRKACVDLLRTKAHTESLDVYPVEAAALRRAADEWETLVMEKTQTT